MPRAGGGSLHEPLIGGGLDLSSASPEAGTWEAKSRVFCRHFRAMYLKRTHYARRDARAVCCMTIMPCVLVLVGLSLIKFGALALTPKALDITPASYPNADTLPLPVYVGDPGGVRDFSDSLASATIMPCGDGTKGSCAAVQGHAPPTDAKLSVHRLSGLHVPKGSRFVFGVNYTDGVPLGHKEAPGSLPAPIIEPAASLAMADYLLEAGDGSQPADVVWGGLVIHNTSFAFGAAVAEGSQTNHDAPFAYTLIQNTSSVHACPIFANLAHNAILNHVHGPGSSIGVHSEPMPQTKAYHSAMQSSMAFTITFFTQVAFAFVPGAMVVFMVRERERHRNSKHQQVISGANVLSYWLGNFAFDMTMFVVTMVLTLLLFVAFDIDPLVSHGALTPVAVLFFGFGTCTTALTYCLSFLYQSHTRAQVLTVVLNLLPFGMVLLILSTVLNFVSKEAADVNQWLMPLYRIFPLYCLPEALNTVTLQTLVSGVVHKGVPHVDYYSTEFCNMPPPPKAIKGNDANAASNAAGDMTPQNNQLLCGLGKDLVMLYLMTVLYLSAAIAMDVLKNYPEYYRRFIRDPEVVDAPFEDDDDVVAERERVLGGGAEGDVIVMKALRKVYGPKSYSKVAVKGVSLGIAKGECFGYLGINGAGKTSTLAMLTGDVLPSSGEAYLNGLDILKHQDQVRRLLGYCPQHDALLERLTVREHLELFGRIKNVAEEALHSFVESILVDMNLSQYQNKLAGELSGGNKRKLSVGIAMIGKPPIIFMDEPSTGMDPVNKRFMWEVIARICTSQKARSPTAPIAAVTLPHAQPCRCWACRSARSSSRHTRWRSARRCAPAPASWSAVGCAASAPSHSSRPSSATATSWTSSSPCRPSAPSPRRPPPSRRSRRARS